MDILLSSSRANTKATGAGSLDPTDSFDYVRGTSHGSSYASQSGSASPSAYNDDTQVIKPSDSRSNLALASGRNESSVPNWSPKNSIANLASASRRPMAAASGARESPMLAEYQDSIKNRNKSRTRLSPWFRPRPIGVRPVRFSFSRIKSSGIPGAIVPMQSLATATGNDGFSSATFNLSSLRNGESSALSNDLVSTTGNRTRDRIREGLEYHKPSVGLSLSGFNGSLFSQDAIFGGLNATNCSGLVTSTAHVIYEVTTSTVLINETTTLGPNATTPLPVFFTPPPACQVITAPCKEVYCPSEYAGPYLPKIPEKPYTASTITSTLLVTKKSAAIVQQLSAVGNLFGPTPPAVPAQPNSDDQQVAGENSGSSSPNMSTQSDDSSSPEPVVDGQFPKKSIPQQNPTNGNSQSASPNSQNSDSQKPAAGSSGSQSTRIDDQTASNRNEPNGVASNDAATSNHGDIVSIGDASGNRDTSSSEGGSSSNGAASNNAKGSSNGDGPEPEGGSSAGSPGTQYVPSLVMAGNLPVSIVSNAVIVGSHTVKAGSPPTTVVAKGQTIAIQPSLIVAQGKSIPIKAASPPPPAHTATIGNVPVVLRPQDVAIGSKTFRHGSSPTSVIHNGQTYSWDASHFVGAGTTVAFLSVDTSAPRVTAGGQEFSVFPSQLKAPGRNIPLPNTATASPFVYKGQTFLVNPSQIIAPDTSITLPPAERVTPFVYIDHSVSVDASRFMARLTTIPLSSGSGIVTYNGQTLTIKPSKIIGPSTTITLSARDHSAASPTAVTTGGLTFSIGPSAAVVGSSTYSFVPGKAPATIVTHGEAVLVGANGVQFRNVHVPVPTMTPSFSAITQGDLAFSIAPSEVVVGSHTATIYSDMTPITTVVNGHSISIGPKGIGLASTTIPLPMPKPSFSTATKGDITFSIAPSEVVVKDKTYSIASNKAPVTTAIDGQRLTIGPKGIHIEGTTVNLPAIQTPINVIAAGLDSFVGSTDAVISGTTYAIGNGAVFQTVVVGSQTLRIGNAGVVLPSTTIAPEQTPVAVTAAGLTCLIDSTEVVINGTTYAIGSGAVAKTVIRGSTTIILGTDGLALPSTTIRPWSNAAQTKFSSVSGTSGAFSAATVTRLLTPIVTGREGDKKHAAGTSKRISNSSAVLGLLLGTLMIGLRLL